MHLSRLGAEIVLWAGEEAGFVELDDAFTLGLVDAAAEEEPRRRRARPRQGAAPDRRPRPGCSASCPGLPLAYNKDLQEDKEYLFDAVDTVDLLLPAMTGMVAGARFRADRMAAAASGGFLAATDLADHLVTLGLALPPGPRGRRAAGARVPRARASASRARRPRTRPRPASRASSCPTLTAEASVEAKGVPGGTARAAVVDQLAAARARVAAW